MVGSALMIRAFADGDGCVGAIVSGEHFKTFLRHVENRQLHPIGTENRDGVVEIRFGQNDRVSDVQAAIESFEATIRLLEAEVAERSG